MDIDEGAGAPPVLSDEEVLTHLDNGYPSNMNDVELNNWVTQYVSNNNRRFHSTLASILAVSNNHDKAISQIEELIKNPGEFKKRQEKAVDDAAAAQKQTQDQWDRTTQRIREEEAKKYRREEWEAALHAIPHGMVVGRAINAPPFGSGLTPGYSAVVVNNQRRGGKKRKSRKRRKSKSTRRKRRKSHKRN